MTLPTLRNLGHRLRLLGRLVSDALSDHGIDLQQAPLGHALLLLAIPMVLEMVMESVFAVVDILFVARLGADAVAAVGITESLLALVYTAAMGLGIGVTALVARRIGEGRPEAASVVAVQATALGLLVAAVIAAIGVTWTAPLLRLMGADEAVVATGLGYARVSLGSNAVILLLFMLNAVFRGFHTIKGGAGIFHMRQDDRNLASLLEMFSQMFREPFIVQRYLPEVRKGDKRIILIDGEPVGAINRVPAEHDSRSNMHVGGRAEHAELTGREREICARIGPSLRERGFILVGIDVIGDFLTEINVTSPTGVREVKRFGGADIAALFWDAVEAKRP